MSEFWTGRCVVVTGGSGFLGSHLVDRLKTFNPESIFVPRSQEYDLRKAQDIDRLIDEARPNIILHLAAVVGGIGANRENPASFFYDNLMMGAQLLDLAYRKGVEKMVIIGTVCSYPKICPIPFSEEDIWNGYPEETNAPYGLAKKMLIVQSDCYARQHGFNSISLVPTNLYGPRDNFDPKSSHVIPAMILKCFEAMEEEKEEIVLWGTGSPTREFLYVGDCVEGILLGAEHYNEPNPVNLGSGSEISIKDLAGLIAGLTGFQGKIRWDDSMPDGQPRRSVSVERAAKFGFHAQTSFEQGLKTTIEWFRKNR